MQTSTKVDSTTEEICQTNFSTADWVPVTIPSTVLAGLVENGFYKNPYKGLNLKKIPEKLFQVSWWFRNQFVLTSTEANKTVILEFQGINYCANLWLNGQKIAESKEVYGAFRQFKLNISDWVTSGENVLVLEVFPPRPGDFSIGFVDWNPEPPDRNMGIFREVILHFCSDVSIENPFVVSEVDSRTLNSAKLTISGEVVNHSDKSTVGVLECEIDTFRISQTVSLAAGEQKLVSFTPQEFQELTITNPKLWWPNNLGDPNLYQLRLLFRSGGKIMDQSSTRFGIRTVKDYVNEGGHRGFMINGKKVLIKSGGWTDDLFLENTRENLETQVQYVKDMNLNCIRLEGIWGKDHKLYDLCDENGILMMVGWSCHWEHKQYLGKPVDNRFGGVISPEDISLVSRMWEDQVKWLRNHPSIFVWTVASDKVPHPDLEKKYIQTFEKYDSTRPYLNSTGGIGSEQGIITDHLIVSEISGSSRVKMLGPYAYTPPVYWFTDKNLGGAYGFNTETGPGVQPPVLKSIKKFIPEDHLWPIDKVWEFHCGLNEFGTLSRFLKAMTERYGAPNDLADFSQKAQVMNYELMRPMFEAFQANKGLATGVVQWMLNSAWPKMFWQLYDYYLAPNAAFYATKKACEPLHLLYHYGNNSVHFINDTFKSVEKLSILIRIFDVNARELFHQVAEVNGSPESAAEILKLPALKSFDETCFLDLRLLNRNRVEIGNNFYWLSAKPDVLDYENRVEPWPYYTVCKANADFSKLHTLARVEIDAEFNLQNNKNTEVILTNPTNSIAFFIYLDVVEQTTDESILPIFWSDNYVSLLPGERKILEARIAGRTTQPRLVISGWNVFQKKINPSKKGIE